MCCRPTDSTVVRLIKNCLRGRAAPGHGRGDTHSPTTSFANRFSAVGRCPSSSPSPPSPCPGSDLPAAAAPTSRDDVAGWRKKTTRESAAVGGGGSSARFPYGLSCWPSRSKSTEFDDDERECRQRMVTTHGDSDGESGSFWNSTEERLSHAQVHRPSTASRSPARLDSKGPPTERERHHVWSPPPPPPPPSAPLHQPGYQHQQRLSEPNRPTAAAELRSSSVFFGPHARPANAAAAAAVDHRRRPVQPPRRRPDVDLPSVTLSFDGEEGYGRKLVSLMRPNEREMPGPPPNRRVALS